MRSLVFGLLLALLDVGCGGATGADEGTHGGTGEDASFEETCDPNGTWTLEYEAAESACGIDSLERAIVITTGKTLPLSLPNAPSLTQIQEATIGQQGCRISAKWGWEQEMGGEGNEMDGEQNALDLVLSSPDTAEGALVHTTYWTCGYQDSNTFIAHARRL